MDDAAEKHSEVFQSRQENLFNFNIAVPAVGRPGLRKPQVAALYARLGHLVVNPSSTATVVMPTGTGKTDTMLALLIAGRLPRTLILVPATPGQAETSRVSLAVRNSDGPHQVV